MRPGFPYPRSIPLSWSDAALVSRCRFFRSCSVGAAEIDKHTLHTLARRRPASSLQSKSESDNKVGVRRERERTAVDDAREDVGQGSRGAGPRVGHVAGDAPPFQRGQETAKRRRFNGSDHQEHASRRGGVLWHAELRKGRPLLSVQVRVASSSPPPPPP